MDFNQALGYDFKSNKELTENAAEVNTDNYEYQKDGDDNEEENAEERHKDSSDDHVNIHVRIARRYC